MDATRNLGDDHPGDETVPGAQRRVRRNLAVSALTVGWTAVMQIALVPVYVKLLGPAGYGLVGFFIALRTALQVCDLGMSTAVNRELAAVYAGAEPPAAGRGVVRTLGRANWAVGAGISAALAFLAPWIASHWLHGGAGDAEALAHTVRLMALAFLLQWPVTFYEAGLYGLQRLGAQGSLRALFTTLSGAAGVLVLLRVAPTPDAWFLSQAAVAAVQLVATMLVFHRLLPGGGSAAGAAPSRLWRSTVAAGVAMATVALLAQFATLLLARLLSPERFGAYALAAVGASGLLILVAPIYNVAYPRLAELTARGDADGTRQAFRGALRLAALLVVPAAVTLAMTAEEVLRLWTRDAAIAAAAAPALRPMAAGWACLALAQLPFALDLAQHRSRTLSAVNLASLAAGAVALAIGVPRWGLDALWALALIQLLHLLCCVLLLPRPVFAHATGTLARRDVLPIALAAVAAAWAVRLALGPAPHAAVVVLLTALATMTGALVASAPARALLLSLLRSRRAIA